MTKTIDSLILVDGHYLNLPVMNDTGEIVGMVDVLKLTYATLEQINTMSTGDSEGPAWNKFWLSLDNETESIMSGEGSHHHTTTGGRSLMSPDLSRGHERILDASVAPGDSASHVGVDSPAQSVAGRAETAPEDVPFPFKFKAPSGRTHRLQVTASHGLGELIEAVIAKLGGEVEAVGGRASFEDGKLGASGFALSYLDTDGDTVSITTDQDLLEAIVLARQSHREKVDLYVHDPEKPAISVAPEPQVALPTPPISTVRERRRVASESEDESEEESRIKSRKSKTKPAPVEKELIAGVPNDLLLPGAIVTLAVVIVGVFAITRASSR